MLSYVDVLRVDVYYVDVAIEVSVGAINLLLLLLLFLLFLLLLLNIVVVSRTDYVLSVLFSGSRLPRVRRSVALVPEAHVGG